MNKIHIVDGQFRNSTSIVEKYQAPSLITIDCGYPAIIFTENVNAEQRDEDIDKRSFIKGNSRLHMRKPKVKVKTYIFFATLKTGGLSADHERKYQRSESFTYQLIGLSRMGSL